MGEAAPPLADGRYRLIDVLGAGGMATVYRGYDSRLQVQRAIKILSPALARKRSLRTRFEGEASTMALLEHRHIVRVYDVGADGDRVYIIMELIDSGSLLDRVKNGGALPPRMACQVTIDMLEALTVAHDRGVVHRDIKPHNILLGSDGNVRITDFGIARMRQDEDDDGMTKTGAVMGTWGFMAPEQRVDAKSVDTRADLYSVGATLYAILTDQTPVDLFVADMDARLLADLPEPVAEFIRTSCKYDRDDRYPDARTMCEALRKVLDQLPPDPEGTLPLVDGRALDPVPAAVRRAGGGTGLVQGTPKSTPAPQRPALATMVPDVADLSIVADLPDEPDDSDALHEEDVDDDPTGLSVIDEPAAAAGPPVGLILGGLIAVIGLGGGVWFATQSDAVEAPVEVPEVVPGLIQPVDVERDPVEPVESAPVEPVVEPEVTPEPVVAEVEAPKEPTPSPEPTVKVTAKGVQHTAPSSASAGGSVTLTFRLPSDDYKVTLYSKATGGKYAQKTLYGNGGAFSATLALDASYAGKHLEYYLKATPRSGGSDLTYKSGFSPQKVAVR